MKRSVWLGLIFAPPVPVTLWFWAAINDYLPVTHLGLGIVPMFVFGLLASYVVAMPILSLCVAMLKRARLLSAWSFVAMVTGIGFLIPFAWITLGLGWPTRVPLVSTSEVSQSTMVASSASYAFIASICFSAITGMQWRAIR